MKRLIQVTLALALAALLCACTTTNVLPAGVGTEDAGTSPEPDGGSGDGGITPSPEAEPEPTLPRSCEADTECDDGIDCTADTCLESGTCQWTVLGGQCLVGQQCHAEGAANPRQPCQVCDPSADPLAFSNSADGAPCQDGDACTEGDTCAQGSCVAGDAVACADDNPCTQDSCDAARGCLFEPGNEAEACDDSDPCTEADTCTAGACAGAPLDCDDDNTCTDDSCAEGVCTNTDNTSPCEDGNACTVGDTCAGGECGAGEAPNCEDGNICTIDGCDVVAGCFHLPTENPCCVGQDSICDDGDPCTSDLCDPATSDCIYEFNTATCDDNSACTDSDTCSEGQCGGREIVCDDRNDCTEDVCNDTLGCVEVPLDEGACDDGVECTTQDACVGGVCVGDDEACVCEPDFGQTAAKFNQVAFADPGQGLDLTNDGMVNNQLGALGAIANDPLQEGVDGGNFILLLDFIDFQQNPFELAAYDGQLDGGNIDCDFQNEVCDYLAGEGLFDPETCDPTVTLSATLNGDQLRAGGPGTVFPFEVPFAEGSLALTIYEVRIEATVEIVNGQLVSISGILGGAVRRDDLLQALRGLPEDALPFPVDSIAPLLDRIIMDDIDTTDDGVDMPDAASLMLSFEGLRARIVGLTP